MWHADAVQAMMKVQKCNKADFDKQHVVGEVVDLKVGDWVFVRAPLGWKNNLSPDYHGPYQIVRFKDPECKTAQFEIPKWGLHQRVVRFLTTAHNLTEE